jgi:hypothetical protein
MFSPQPHYFFHNIKIESILCTCAECSDLKVRGSYFDWHQFSISLYSQGIFFVRGVVYFFQHLNMYLK